MIKFDPEIQRGKNKNNIDLEIYIYIYCGLFVWGKIVERITKTVLQFYSTIKHNNSCFMPAEAVLDQ